MATLAFVLAACVDPVQAGLVLAIILVHRGPQPILVAAAVAAVVSETASVLVADEHAWGELLAPRAVASLLQAAILAWLVRFIRQSRTGGDVAQAEAGAASGNATASLAAEPPPPVSRIAPWHMRTYVRRRLKKLRSR